MNKTGTTRRRNTRSVNKTKNKTRNRFRTKNRNRIRTKNKTRNRLRTKNRTRNRKKVNHNGGGPKDWYQKRDAIKKMFNFIHEKINHYYDNRSGDDQECTGDVENLKRKIKGKARSISIKTKSKMDRQIRDGIEYLVKCKDKEEIKNINDVLQHMINEEQRSVAREKLESYKKLLVEETNTKTIKLTEVELKNIKKKVDEIIKLFTNKNNNVYRLELYDENEKDEILTKIIEDSYKNSKNKNVNDDQIIEYNDNIPEIKVGDWWDNSKSFVSELLKNSDNVKFWIGNWNELYNLEYSIPGAKIYPEVINSFLDCEVSKSDELGYINIYICACRKVAAGSQNQEEWIEEIDKIETIMKEVEREGDKKEKFQFLYFIIWLIFCGFEQETSDFIEMFIKICEAISNERPLDLRDAETIVFYDFTIDQDSRSLTDMFHLDVEAWNPLELNWLWNLALVYTETGEDFNDYLDKIIDEQIKIKTNIDLLRRRESRTYIDNLKILIKSAGLGGVFEDFFLKVVLLYIIENSNDKDYRRLTDDTDPDKNRGGIIKENKKVVSEAFTKNLNNLNKELEQIYIQLDEFKKSTGDCINKKNIQDYNEKIIDIINEDFYIELYVLIINYPDNLLNEWYKTLGLKRGDIEKMITKLQAATEREETESKLRIEGYLEGKMNYLEQLNKMKPLYYTEGDNQKYETALKFCIDYFNEINKVRVFVEKEGIQTLKKLKEIDNICNSKILEINKDRTITGIRTDLEQILKPILGAQSGKDYCKGKDKDSCRGDDICTWKKHRFKKSTCEYQDSREISQIKDELIKEKILNYKTEQNRSRLKTQLETLGYDLNKVIDDLVKEIIEKNQ